MFYLLFLEIIRNEKFYRVECKVGVGGSVGEH